MKYACCYRVLYTNRVFLWFFLKVVPIGTATRWASLVSSTPPWYRTVQERLRSACAEFWRRRCSRESCLTWCGGCAHLGSSPRCSELFISKRLKQADQGWTVKQNGGDCVENAVRNGDHRVRERGWDWRVRKMTSCPYLVLSARTSAHRTCTMSNLF